ncbi:Uncharacterized membrane protein [Flexibacter flexilis DSM 6793]|uniref:Uncharacterized membrane protein n=1 Tax=Flexibacter flexilis DSM 6793 TaxID=927664 RepID=A0A1I1G1I3_9BACT|nr:DUF502 domain-containing protein [Flexibacter flexilis]SFC05699.1 Uncharacterized membrane protein [Flexibacter flexilis DSM 6793]
MAPLLTKIFNRTARYFLQGLLFAVPIAVTGYVIVSFFRWVEGLIPVKDQFTGLGTLIIFAGLTFLGFLGSSFLTRRVFQLFDKLLNSLPLVKIIYSSLKDLISAFVGEEKKFNQAVLVTLNPEAELQKIGFITQQDLSRLGVVDKVAVYLPHAYAVSGDLFVVPARNVAPIDVDSSDIMKFIVSGGVAGLPAAVAGHREQTHE